MTRGRARQGAVPGPRRHGWRPCHAGSLAGAHAGGSLERVTVSPDALELPGPLVSAAWLAPHLGPPLVVLDATVIMPPPERDGDYRAESGSARFAEGHIPTAVHADLLGDLADGSASYHFARPSPGELAAALGPLGIGDGCPVVTYDSAGGVWAARLWWMLRWIGVPAAVLDGGWQGWVSSGGAIETGAPGSPGRAGAAAGTGAAGGDQRPPARGSAAVTPRERTGMWVRRADVLEIISGARPGHLVCALSAELFAGTAPTRYSRRGHIPSSRCLPARSVLDADGRMRPPEELAQAAAGIPADGSPVIVYCGGGISAAAVAHALTLIGRPEVAIYDGSLEEWSADPALPLDCAP
jgi:thiosulfate/3-mercaptopyruvate sulfurtransferase